MFRAVVCQQVRIRRDSFVQGVKCRCCVYATAGTAMLPLGEGAEFIT